MKNFELIVVLTVVLFIVTVGIMHLAIIYIWFSPLPYDQLVSDIKKYHLDEQSIIVIDPLITANAYSENGFYDYFKGTCDTSCLTVKLNQTVSYSYTSSKNALEIFKRLNLPIMDDIKLSKNPDLLDDYETVIVLHSEYLTQELFDKLQEHRHVLYMYPNALYGKVTIDNDEITLIRGHDVQHVANGFDWKFDNTHYEEDGKCLNPHWLLIDNGFQLNCYPDDVIFDHPELFNFPNS